MTPIACRVVLVVLLATLTASGSARAAPVVLPPDFFLEVARGAESKFDLTQQSERLFEVRYHLPGQALPREAGVIAVMATTCIAAGLSISRGFSGFAMTTPPAPPEGELKELVVTIALLNDRAELARLASPGSWTPYYTNGQARDGGCKHILNPRYLP